LEKRDAESGFDSLENVAPASDPIHFERPRDLLKVLEDAAALVRNDRRITAAAKGHTLTSIVGAAARIMPLVETADLQEKDWEKTKRQQEELYELVSNSPRAREAVKTLIEISFQRSAATGKPLAITSQLEDLKSELNDRKG
jgi:hypothetical protein